MPAEDGTESPGVRPAETAIFAVGTIQYVLVVSRARLNPQIRAEPRVPELHSGPTLQRRDLEFLFPTFVCAYLGNAGVRQGRRPVDR